MGHMIEKAKFIERENRNGPAWHSIGTVLGRDKRISTVEAIQMIGGDYTVKVVPQVVVYDGVQHETGKHIIVRLPDANDPTTKPNFYGEVSGNWEPIQNLDLVTLFEKASEVFELETMGVLREGRTFFFTLRDEPFDIRVNGKDNAHESYFYGFNYHEPGSSVIFGKGNVRVVCWNTLNMGLSSARVVLPLTHHKGLNAFAAFVAKAMQQRASMAKAERDALQMMAEKPITAAQAVDAFKAAWPTPQRPRLLVSLDGLKGQTADLMGGTVNVDAISLDEDMGKRIARTQAIWEDSCNRAKKMQDLAMESLMNMADSEGLGLNQYTLMQAVTETEQWRADARGNVAAAAIFGPGADSPTRLLRWMGYPQKELVPVTAN